MACDGAVRLVAQLEVLGDLRVRQVVSRLCGGLDVCCGYVVVRETARLV